MMALMEEGTRLARARFDRLRVLLLSLDGFMACGPVFGVSGSMFWIFWLILDVPGKFNLMEIGGGIVFGMYI